ncbi:permease-like cell division protein FtsX [Anaerosacchariphilus polymeriproducens]|uniref:Cell division protein FtsX n=1 Tax=Anaerosacchariphilus polymeriproducens TaxID=1812858 RepID=A0A371ASX8_9FIRM|nr:permease-like cell division protein FtsX [Anaerosacchariphilus polymeriproducens]RDU22683.1 ABC transporter permease [Anaerosacchariphilus polymeriproducens]
MRISTIYYCLKQGIKNIFRNKMFSLASIATMSACIFLFGIFFAVVVNFKHIVKEAQTGVAVTAFFDEGIKEDKINQIIELVKKRAEVDHVNYVSAEDAWKKFQEDYFKNAKELVKGFQNDNPLKDSANLEIYLNDISMQKDLVTFLQSIDGIRQINKSESTAETLSNFNVLIGYISAAIILILLAVSVFLIGNTVTIGISVRKEEIGIMKLIGSTDFFVRAPFIVEGIIIGLLGSIFPLFILYFIYNEAIQYIMQRFNILVKLLQFLPAEKVFSTLIPTALILGVGIGFISSFTVTRKHLKV